MPPEEQSALAAELLAGDADNAVGPDFSVRGGLYRDFLYGFTFRKPPGLWEAHTGDDATGISPDSVLVLRQPARGLYVAVIPEFLDDLSPRQYHQVLLENMGAAEDTPVRPLKHGGMMMRASQFDLDVEGLAFRYVLVSVVHDDVGVQVIAWSLKPNLPRPEELAAVLAESLDFPDPKTVASVMKGPLYRDYRLGYQVAAPGKEWSLKPQPASETDAVSSKVMLAREGTVCVFMAMCLQDMTDELLLQVMDKVAGTMEFKERTRKESRDTLANLPARRITMTGRLGLSPASMSLWTARRGNTVHGLIMVTPRTRLDPGREVTVESCKSCLSLID